MTHANSGRSANVAMAEDDQELARAALAVLDANWLGHATRPGRLYPHQWSWDAACIAMGRVAWDQDRAEQELRSLFAAQWRNGLVPHIVFTDADQYFPGPDFWHTERAASAPISARTSGIVQPPVHATAAWRLFLRAPDRVSATEVLRELFPKLAAWHEYLYRDRTRDGEGLVEVWHPWESGMDNSPAWDGALRAIALSADQVPLYERVDNLLGDPQERPSDFDYDRYSYLVAFMREVRYEPGLLHESCPFAIQPTLFNSLLVQANRDLASIARLVGENPLPHERLADLTATSLEKLWNAERRLYLDFDLRSGTHVESSTAAAFAPLYAGVPSTACAAQLVEQLGRFIAELDDGQVGVASIALDDSELRPQQYWRGPIWPLIQWVIAIGLDRYGYTRLGTRLRRTTVELAREHGFWEHYNPLNGTGQGDGSFSWTAGLVLEMLAGSSAVGEDRDGVGSVI